MANYSMGVAFDVTPSDSEEIKFNWVTISVAGSVAIEQAGGNVVTINPPVGIWIPIGEGIKLLATGTTATGIVAV